MSEKRGSYEWSKVRGYEFTPEEARDASDFCDLMESYFVRPEELRDFIGDKQLRIGHRLYLSEILPIDDISPVLFGEDDDRVCAIAKARCVENSREGRTIIMPWEANR